MYEARQNKEKVSRSLDGGSGITKQRIALKHEIINSTPKFSTNKYIRQTVQRIIRIENSSIAQKEFSLMDIWDIVKSRFEENQYAQSAIREIDSYNEIYATFEDLIKDIEDNIKGQKIIESMLNMKGLETFKWGGARETAFTKWLNNKSDSKLTQANCWNSILYAAYQAQIITKEEIKNANNPIGQSSSTPMIVSKIVESPSGSIIFDDEDKKEKTKKRYKKIPKGHIVILGKRGDHVCLSLGNGRVLELDKRNPIQYENPHYVNDQDSQKEIKKEIIKLSGGIAKKVKGYENLLIKRRQLQEQLEKYIIQAPANNQIEEIDLIELSYITNPNIDGIYWGRLPNFQT